MRVHLNEMSRYIEQDMSQLKGALQEVLPDIKEYLQRGDLQKALDALKYNPMASHALLQALEQANDNIFVMLNIIPSRSFMGCELKHPDVYIPANVTGIGADAFLDSNIKSITFDEGIHTLGRNALAGENVFEEITLPHSLFEDPEDINNHLRVGCLGRVKKVIVHLSKEDADAMSREQREAVLSAIVRSIVGKCDIVNDEGKDIASLLRNDYLPGGGI